MFAEWTVKQARDKAAELKVDIAKGKNLAQECSAIRGEMKLNEPFALVSDGA